MRGIGKIEKYFMPHPIYIRQGIQTMHLDHTDLKILSILQSDCTAPLNHISKQVNLSPTPCWRRIKRLEELGVILGKVALIDGAKVQRGTVVFVNIRTNEHNQQWLEYFRKTVLPIPEVMEAYRMAGQWDYLLKVQVQDLPHFDRFYKYLVSQIDLYDVTSTFAMEHMKYTTKVELEM